jgi:hypothetical protein
MPKILDGGEVLAIPLPVDRPVDPYRVVRDARPASSYATLSKRPVGGRVEVDDRAYNRGSAVTLPFQYSTAKLVVPAERLIWKDETCASEFEQSNPDAFREWDALFAKEATSDLTAPANDRLTLALVAIACLLFAGEENEGVGLLVAGHSARDEDEFGPELATARAENLRALITGGRDKFAQTCVAFNIAADLKPIGHFLGSFFGWAFSAAAVDDPTAAVAEFRTGYNERRGKPSFEGWFGEALADAEGITAADWGGLFDCYSMVIAALAGATTAGDLKTARARVKFVGDGQSGFGSAVTMPGDGFRSRSDRRVEILGFAQDVTTRVSGDLEGAYVACDYLTLEPKWLLATPKTVYTLESSLEEGEGAEPFVIKGTLPKKPEGLDYIDWLFENDPAWHGAVPEDEDEEAQLA